MDCAGLFFKRRESSVKENLLSKRIMEEEDGEKRMDELWHALRDAGDADAVIEGLRKMDGACYGDGARRKMGAEGGGAVKEIVTALKTYVENTELCTVALLLLRKLLDDDENFAAAMDCDIVAVLEGVFETNPAHVGVVASASGLVWMLSGVPPQRCGKIQGSKIPAQIRSSINIFKPLEAGSATLSGTSSESLALRSSDSSKVHLGL